MLSEFIVDTHSTKNSLMYESCFVHIMYEVLVFIILQKISNAKQAKIVVNLIYSYLLDDKYIVKILVCAVHLCKALSWKRENWAWVVGRGHGLSVKVDGYIGARHLRLS